MAVLLAVAVVASVTGAYAVAVCGAEASHLQFFQSGLEDQNPLFSLAMVSEEGAGSHDIISTGCGGREVGQGGLDLRILLCGGGGELVHHSVSGGGSRASGYVCIKNQVAINATETVRAKINL